MVRAVVDVGSNSVLLLVAETDGRTLRPMIETSEVTGLGFQTKTTGLLRPEAMDRTLKALARAKLVAHQYGANRCDFVATMAVRIAANAKEFQAIAAAQGTPVKVLSGEDEARLGLLSVTSDPTWMSAPRIAVIDPGGHSTEISIVDKETGQTTFQTSFPVGALGIREHHQVDTVPTAKELFAALKEADEVFAPTPSLSPDDLVVSLGATPTNLVAIREGLTEWAPQKVHGATLDYEEISRAVGYMMTLTDEQRATMPGLETGREKTIHWGAFLLERALYALKAEKTGVSVRGWRHAYIETVP